MSRAAQHLSANAAFAGSDFDAAAFASVIVGSSADPAAPAAPLQRGTTDPRLHPGAAAAAAHPHLPPAGPAPPAEFSAAEASLAALRARVTDTNEVIAAHIAAHHTQLVQSVGRLSTLRRDADSLREAVDEVRRGAAKLCDAVLVPAAAVRSCVAQQRRVHAATALLRRVLRALFTSRKIETLSVAGLDHPQGRGLDLRALAKLALSVRELEDVMAYVTAPPPLLLLRLVLFAEVRQPPRLRPPRVRQTTTNSPTSPGARTSPPSWPATGPPRPCRPRGSGR